MSDHQRLSAIITLFCYLTWSDNWDTDSCSTLTTGTPVGLDKVGRYQRVSVVETLARYVQLLIVFLMEASSMMSGIHATSEAGFRIGLTKF